MKQSIFEKAKHKMTTKVPVVLEGETVLDMKRMLKEKMPDIETINYFYVLNKEKKLKGVFSIKEIFLMPDDKKNNEFMNRDIITIRPSTDRERIAILSLRYNLKAIPVVDSDNNFLGVVSSDEILNILRSEKVEDFLRSTGVHSPIRDTLKGNSFFLAKARLPWLIAGLFGGIFAASIVEFFEAPLRSYFILAAFIPLMLYISNAVGIQTQTLLIRNLVLDNKIKLRKHFKKEITTGIMIALPLGIILFLFALVISQPLKIGIILGTSLILAVLVAIIVNILIAWFLYKKKKDPAIGAGPFGTIINDLSSLIFYFSVAKILLMVFGE